MEFSCFVLGKEKRDWISCFLSEGTGFVSGRMPESLGIVFFEANRYTDDCLPQRRAIKNAMVSVN